MKNVDLPPLPSVNSAGPDVCEVVSLYLAVWNDLSAEQQQLLSAHMKECPDCATEHRRMQRTSRQLAGLAATSPSPRVDQAVLAAISARSRGAKLPVTRLSQRRPRRSGRRIVTEVVALAAVFMLALLGASHLLTQWMQPQFALPANLTWNGYVLYHTQTEMADNGERIQVSSYHDLGTGQLHVETEMDGKLDVVAVSDKNKTLGKDMMHNIAEWNANEWLIDDSMFDLDTLRKDLKSGSVTYLGKSTYNGKQVYQLRYKDGSILLLDMNYMPVNALESAATPGTAKPMYNTFKVLPTASVPDSTWDMTVPANFKVGKIANRP